MALASRPKCNMGKPGSKAKGPVKSRSNPFAVKKSGKKSKTKKDKLTLDAVDKTFNDLQKHRKVLITSPQKSDLMTHQDKNKLDRACKTNVTNLDELVSVTAHTGISSS